MTNIISKIKSIRFQVLAIMLVCYLVPTLLLGEYMGHVFFADLQEKTETALTSSAEHALTLTRQSVERAITMAKDATYDGEITSVYAAYESGAVGGAEFLQNSRNYLERKYSRESLFTFAAYFPVSNPDMLIYNRAGYECALVYQRDAHARVQQIGETLDTRCQFIQQGGEVYLVRNLYNLRMERYGMLVLGVAQDLLFEQLTRLADSWDARAEIRLDDAGETALELDSLVPGLAQTQDARNITYSYAAYERDYALGMRMTIARERVYGEIEAFRRMMKGLILLLVPIMALILLFVSKRIVRPIRILSQASHRIEEGEFGVTVPMHGDDELGDLGRAFSAMSTRIANLIDKTYKEEIALRDARIQAMQSRINPHFINNALESINWQARMEGSESISAMVESLSVLFNASMARGDRHVVPLREEADVAKAYFYFIGLRFGERLHIDVQMEAEALESMLPLLTIQPLLENAVEHGIAPAGGGSIGLSCRLEAGQLILEVRNSGRALDENDKRRIALALSGDSQGGHHLGLANIASRLRLIYGDRARIHMYADDVTGETVVHLSLPPRSDMEKQEEERGESE